MTRLIELIKAHPLYALVIAGAIVLFLFVAANGIGKTIEVYRANKFDRAQAAKEQEIAGLKADREAAIKRGDEAETKALLKEAENKELKDLIAAKGGQIETAAKELEAKIEEAKHGAGACAGSADPNSCLCAKLKALGFECN
jgi:flagellar biosynthesis/type III secretory pathway protein FliH